jgi:hypothetical protein
LARGKEHELPKKPRQNSRHIFLFFYRPEIRRTEPMKRSRLNQVNRSEPSLPEQAEPSLPEQAEPRRIEPRRIAMS